MKLTAQHLAAFGTVVCFIVIALGAATRLQDAGLGCPDWPGCYGHFFIPDTEQEIATAQLYFADTPFEAEKAIIEMVHRFAASSLGLIAIVLVLLCGYIAQDTLPRSIKAHAVALLLLIVTQGVFGYLTVAWKLLPIIVTSHLLGGVLVTLTFFGLFLRLRTLSKQTLTSLIETTAINLYVLFLLRIMAIILFIAVFLQLALGGWVAANYAATACPDFPTCQGTLIPEADYATGFTLIQDIGPNYLGGELTNQARIAIHFAHRVGALFIVLLVGLFALLLMITKQKKLLHTLTGLTVIQIGLGIANVMFAFPLAIAVLHNLVAVLLLCTTLIAVRAAFIRFSAETID